MKPEEINKLTNFLRKRFNSPELEIRRLPNKADSAEVYFGDEFVGLIYRDDEDDDLSYSFQMAILEFDLE